MSIDIKSIDRPDTVTEVTDYDDVVVFAPDHGQNISHVKRQSQQPASVSSWCVGLFEPAHSLSAALGSYSHQRL